MRWWETSIGGRARARIIALLRRRPHSVEELAADLGVTDNAARAHVQALERADIVRGAGVRRAGTVGKPATLYEIAAEAEPFLSAAYAPVLRELLIALGDRLAPAALDDLFREVGRRLAVANGVTGDAGAPTNAKQLDSRVRAAGALLEALGSEVEIERTRDAYFVRGFACPVSSAVAVQPKVCHAVEELVGGVVGVAVTECCDRSGRARCCFQIPRPA
jgi:predicted ArsR family transcriptional regulator